MLTNDDLRKIGDLIDQRFEVKLEQKLEEKLEQKFEEKLEPIRGDILTIKDNISVLKKDIKSLKNSDRKIRKDLNLILKYSDGARADHEKRIIRLEDNSHLSPME